ncbi:MAG: AAA family ATPase [Phycisphaerales bacterium]|nr:AAA family ATPase [Phycisphaerales bacterium]
MGSCRSYTVRTFTVINQKGGCGKTTSAINLASAFAKTGCRTLLVDLDPQSHCAAGLGVPEDRLDLDVSDALRAPVDQPLNRDRLIWHVSRHLDLLPSRMKLAGIEAAQGGLADQDNKALRLRSVLNRLRKIEPSMDEGAESNSESSSPALMYDVCVIDCPPSIGLLSYNAIAAGREVVIPVETSFFSLRGAAKQVQTARSIARKLGMRIHPRLLATMHDPSQPLARDLLDDLRDRFGAGMIPIVVRYDHALKEAASFGQPIDEYDDESMGAEDYRSVCEWLVEHVDIDRPEPDSIVESKPMPVSTLANASLTRAPQSGSSDGDGAPLSRAQELAMRARNMQQAQFAPQTQKPTSSSATAVLETKPVVLKRSLMPHRPVAIELVDDRVVRPSQAPAIDYTKVKHLFGIRKTSKGVLFVQPKSIGSRIELAGDFNDWKPEQTSMTCNEAIGVFEKHLILPKGRYAYKLVIDGKWCLDPYNPDRAENGLGGRNNVVRID